MGQFLGQKMFGEFFGGEGAQKCSYDGVVSGCHAAALLLAGDAAIVGPEDTSPRLLQNPRSGEIAWGVFKAFNNGQAGWWADTNGPSVTGGPTDEEVIAFGVDSVHIPFNSDRNAYYPDATRPRIHSTQSDPIPPPGPPPPPTSEDPCAGKKGELDFSGKGKDWGIRHITPRHIQQTSDNLDKSRYRAYGFNTSLEDDQEEVMDLDQTTFELGGAFPQKDGRIAYIYAFPASLPARMLGGFKNIGLDRTVNSSTGIPNSDTNVNTVIVDGDCETVITSFPGVPGWVSPFNPNINGVPIWAPPGSGFTLRH